MLEQGDVLILVQETIFVVNLQSVVILLNLYFAIFKISIKKQTGTNKLWPDHGMFLLMVHHKLKTFWNILILLQMLNLTILCHFLHCSYFGHYITVIHVYNIYSFDP
jgi:hypothetical protein